MSDPYIGEIRLFAGTFAPAGWLFCDGSLVSIADYDTLFNLIGTTYGGDGVSTFALPDLRGRIPLHPGRGAQSAFVLGQAGGTETVTLTQNQIPAHAHAFRISAASGGQSSPQNGLLGTSNAVSTYNGAAPSTPAAPSSVAATGRTQPHDNLMPFLAVSFIISMFGIYPSQT